MDGAGGCMGDGTASGGGGRTGVGEYTTQRVNQ